MSRAPNLLSINAYHYRRGGSEAVYFDHARMFEARGWGAAFLSMQHPENEASRWSEYFVDEIEWGHDYTLWERMVKATKVIYSFEARRKLDRLLQTFPADVAHAHQIYHHLSPSILPLLKQRGVRTVLTAHDLKLACPAYTMRNAGGVCERCKGGRVWNVALHRCVADSRLVSGLVFVETLAHRTLGLYRKTLDRIVAPSRFYLEKLIEWGWDRERLVHIPNFVDAESFPRIEGRAGYLAYFGRLSGEKGLSTLIDAARAAGVPGVEARVYPAFGVTRDEG
ncbi:MAG: glycosyltransferase, partial [Pseudomonadota bacterium]